MPSRTDSFGIVFLEAWANALPVVAAAAGGVPDVVRHGEAGLLVPFGDLDRLVRGPRRPGRRPRRARALGAAGRKLVERGHTWDDRFATLEGRARAIDFAEGSRPAEGPRAAPHRRAASPSRATLD